MPRKPRRVRLATVRGQVTSSRRARAANQPKPVVVVRPAASVGRPRRRRRAGRRGRRSSLLGDIAATAGGFISPAAARIGRRLGTGIARIFGRGEYVMSNVVNSNTLAGTTPPQFGDASGTTRIRHREFISDVSGSTAFAITSFKLQPGLSQLFPWLNRIAANYEQYKLMGVVIEFKSTSAAALNSTNTALGVVGLVTQYDSSEAAFQTKQEAEMYVGCQTANPAQSILHFVECASGQNPLDKMYVRTGPLNAAADPKFYDYGIVNIFTQGMQAVATIGELWISYDIEFSKPKLYTSLSGTGPSDNYVLGVGLTKNALDLSNSNWTAGTTVYPTYGALGTYMINNTVHFPDTVPGGDYAILISEWTVTGNPPAGQYMITSGTLATGSPYSGALPSFKSYFMKDGAMVSYSSSSSGLTDRSNANLAIVSINLPQVRSGLIKYTFQTQAVAAWTGSVQVLVFPMPPNPPITVSKGTLMMLSEITAKFSQYEHLLKGLPGIMPTIEEEESNIILEDLE